jgi:hypothetical protein
LVHHPTALFQAFLPRVSVLVKATGTLITNFYILAEAACCSLPVFWQNIIRDHSLEAPFERFRTSLKIKAFFKQSAVAGIMHRSETGGIVAEHCGGGNMSENEDGDGAPRQYIGPPRPRKGTAQALIWNFMMPYSSAEGSRNVECCILVPDADGSGMRKCGATFKHTMGE